MNKEQIETAREYERLLRLETDIENVDLDNNYLEESQIEEMRATVRAAVDKCRAELGIQ